MGHPERAGRAVRIGSITKQLTVALLLRLAEAGLLDVDDPVSSYLPDYPKPQGDRVTLHHLLTHTSGIPSCTGFPDFGEEYARNPFTPDSLVAVFSKMDLELEQQHPAVCQQEEGPFQRGRHERWGYLLGIAVRPGLTHGLTRAPRLLSISRFQRLRPVRNMSRLEAAKRSPSPTAYSQ